MAESAGHAFAVPEVELRPGEEPLRCTDYRYRVVNFEAGSRIVRFAGPAAKMPGESKAGGFWTATLLKGYLGQRIGSGLICLSRPSGLIRQVQSRRWTVTVPRRTKFTPGIAAAKTARGDFRNQARTRTVLMIEGPEVAVLRFARPIPRPLVLALKTIFEGKRYPPSALTVLRSPSYNNDEPDQEESHEGHDQEGADAAGLRAQSQPGIDPQPEGPPLDGQERRGEDGLHGSEEVTEPWTEDEDAALQAGLEQGE